MIKIEVVYTDNSAGHFCCEKVDYTGRALSFITTDGEYIVIPYYNAYIIKEKEVEDDGSV